MGGKGVSWARSTASTRSSGASFVVPWTRGPAVVRHQRRTSPLACVISVGVRPPRTWSCTSCTPPGSTLPWCSEVRGRAGGEQKAVVLSTFPGGALDLGVVKADLHDPRVEVVEHPPVGHPTQKGERMAMELNPGRQRRLEDTRHRLMPTIGQDHHQGPGLAERPGGRINHAARLATIDLGFAPRLACHAPGGWWAMGLELVDKPVEGRSAPHHTCPLKVSRGPWSSWAPLRNSGMTGDSNSLIPHLQAQKRLSGQL